MWYALAQCEKISCLEVLHLKRLNDAVDRFARSHPRFGIPNLMKVLVIGNIIVYFLARFSSWSALSFLAFDPAAVLHGEIWRIITFIFVPNNFSPFALILSLYFYYFIGNLLEQQWGTPKFNLYYFSGVVLTILTSVIATLATGVSQTVMGTYYVNMSMFLAFAALYPDMQVLLFFIIPIKVKWLAWADAALFAVDILGSLFRLDFLGALLPVIALLNFLVFFWSDLTGTIRYHRSRARHQNSYQTIHFKSAVKQQEKKAREQGYHHKCCVCGRTDTEYPNLQFRYCSRCAGYHCFCEDHIFNHVHFTE